jgi:hypothetical protein
LAVRRFISLPHFGQRGAAVSDFAWVACGAGGAAVAAGGATGKGGAASDQKVAEPPHAGQPIVYSVPDFETFILPEHFGHLSTMGVLPAQSWHLK